ncbi:hypothetical protein [Tateyamaria sp. ANG-S1]|uniref:hypothetical protein n=1 Tax=Tateyamaria sp. ANG-S1 TaxID=1577905 RepID=UPI00057E7288|nr:hypothetical protein [Tateyamaria sp. ANG-S1]KIC47731.1 hypothetical protein RA29_19135 [Tateyamaria sp. ANG-S1]
MAKHVVMNLKKVPIKVSGLDIVVPPDLSFKVEVELDKKIAKEATKDPLLVQKFQSQASEILEQTKDTIENKCKVFDKLIVGMIDKGADDKKVKAQLKGLNDAIKNDMKVAQKAAELGVQSTWKELQSKRKEWRGFKIKVGVSIAGTLAGLALSIAGLATSGFSGGVGGVLAIAGFIKSGISLAQDIKKLAIDIEGARVELDGHLKFIEKAAKTKGLYTANEVGAAVLNEFVGISQPSIKSAQDCADTIKAKYAQMIVKVHDLSKTLEKILKEQQKVKKEFLTEAAKRLKKHPIKDKKGQMNKISTALDKELDANYKKVDAQITRIQLMYADTRKWAATIKDLLKRLAKLELKDSKGLKVFREVLKAVGAAAGAIDGNSVASSAQELGLGLGESVGGYVYDKISSKALDGTVFDAA